MDQDYDKKFKELQKYIPFLDSMIQRLENSNIKNESRPAQLIKLQSLKTLLVNNKKRMKIENLLKCEEVLMKIFSKMNKKPDTIDLTKCDSYDNSVSDLARSRENLKNVLKSQESRLKENKTAVEGKDLEKTRELSSYEVNASLSSGPLFFRRSPKPDSKENNSKPIRNYTRVLKSPDKNHICDEDSTSTSIKDLDIFKRRSPIKSPKRRSRSHSSYKRKKQLNKGENTVNSKTKKNTITFSIDEKELLNTSSESIINRIVNCPESDADIDQLRKIRSRIVQELKQNGTNEDISEYILKSYKRKKQKKVKNPPEEIEDGELCESDDELDEVYNDLTLEVSKEPIDSSNSEDETNIKKKGGNKEKQNVKINLKFENRIYKKEKENSEMLNKKCSPVKSTDNVASLEEVSSSDSVLDVDVNYKLSELELRSDRTKHIEDVYSTIDNKEISVGKSDDHGVDQEPNKDPVIGKPLKLVLETALSKLKTRLALNNLTEVTESYVEHMPPKSPDDGHVEVNIIKQNKTESLSPSEFNIKSNDEASIKTITEKSSKMVLDVHSPIPCISEIDILKALNCEINENLEMPILCQTSKETNKKKTPVEKNDSAVTENDKKRRISLEKYKEKVCPQLTCKDNVAVKDFNEHVKKISRNLTAKEIERFSSILNYTSDASYDDDDPQSYSLSNQNISKSLNYTNKCTILGPKSPEPDINSVLNKPPVIIPSEPITLVKPAKESLSIPSISGDIDMRIKNRSINVDSKHRTPSFNSTDYNRPYAIKPSKDDPRLKKMSNCSIKSNLNQDPKEVPFLNSRIVLADGESNVTSSKPVWETKINLAKNNLSSYKAPVSVQNDRSLWDWDVSTRIDNTKSRNSEAVLNESYRPTYEGGKSSRFDGSMTPRYDGNLTPRYDANITSHYDGSITPRYDGSNTPRYDGSMTPRYDGSMTPRYDGSMTPRYDGSMTPRYDGSMTPRYDESITVSYEASIDSNTLSNEGNLTPRYDGGANRMGNNHYDSLSRHSDCNKISNLMTHSEANMTPRYEPNMTPRFEPTMTPCYEPNVTPRYEANITAQCEPNRNQRYERSMTPRYDPNLTHYEPSMTPHFEKNCVPLYEPNELPLYEPNMTPRFEPNSTFRYADLNQITYSNKIQSKEISGNSRNKYVTTWNQENNFEIDNRDISNNFKGIDESDTRNRNFIRDRSILREQILGPMKDQLKVDSYSQYNSRYSVDFHNRKKRESSVPPRLYNDMLHNRTYLQSYKNNEQSSSEFYEKDYYSNSNRDIFDRHRICSNVDVSRSRREKSVGPSLYSDNSQHRFIRSKSVGRSFDRWDQEKGLDQSWSFRQNNSNQSAWNNSELTFNRSKSVGRSLSRAKSLGPKVSTDYSSTKLNLEKFQRSTSVSKSSNDPKSHLNNKVYSHTNPPKKESSEIKSKIDHRTDGCEKIVKKNSNDFKETKGKYEISHKNDNSRKSQSHTKNDKIKLDDEYHRSKDHIKSRTGSDFRNRRDYKSSSDRRHKSYKEDHYKSRSERKDKKESTKGDKVKTVGGLVYTSDNLAKGLAAIPQSYIAKNYKIPKIKKPESELTMKETEKNELETRGSKSDLQLTCSKEVTAAEDTLSEDPNVLEDTSDQSSEKFETRTDAVDPCPNNKSTPESLDSTNSSVNLVNNHSSQDGKLPTECINICDENNILKAQVNSNNGNSSETKEIGKSNEDILKYGDHCNSIVTKDIKKMNFENNVEVCSVSPDNDSSNKEEIIDCDPVSTEVPIKVTHYNEHISDEIEQCISSGIANDDNDIVIKPDSSQEEINNSDNVSPFHTNILSESTLKDNVDSASLNVNNAIPIPTNGDILTKSSNQTCTISSNITEIEKADHTEISTSTPEIENSGKMEPNGNKLDSEVIMEMAPDSVSSTQKYDLYENSSSKCDKPDSTETIDNVEIKVPSEINNVSETDLKKTGIQSIEGILSILTDKDTLKQILPYLPDKLKKKLVKLQCDSDEEIDSENKIIEKEDPREKMIIGNKRKTILKKKKHIRKFNNKKTSTMIEKRVTRQAIVKKDLKKRGKKKTNELQRLHDDINEMFIKEDILNATGIRSCRLTKFVDEKTEENVTMNKKCSKITKRDKSDSDKSLAIENENTNSNISITLTKTMLEHIENNIPKVVISNTEFSTNLTESKEKPPSNSINYSKSRNKLEITPNSEIGQKTTSGILMKLKPGPKSKKLESLKTMIKNHQENERVEALKHIVLDLNESTASVNQSVISSSYNSDVDVVNVDAKNVTTNVRDVKPKPKRKRKKWSSGIIKPYNKKVSKKLEGTISSKNVSMTLPVSKHLKDISYHFLPKSFIYKCKVCSFEKNGIVNHYKKKHPHLGVPISRFSPEIAKKAISQALLVNFLDFNITSAKKNYSKFLCRFCFKKFSFCTLEKRFWHIVSEHTGEYEYNCYICSESENKNCKFKIDIPTPPTASGGLLLGYICGTCNYVQLSFENLKTHIVTCHNSEETTVYNINMCGLRILEKKIHTKTSDIGIQSKEPLESTSSLQHLEIPNSEQIDTGGLVNNEDPSNKAVIDSNMTNSDIVNKFGDDLEILNNLTNEKSSRENSLNKSNLNPDLCINSNKSSGKSNIISQQEKTPLSDLNSNKDENISKELINVTVQELKTEIDDNLQDDWLDEALNDIPVRNINSSAFAIFSHSNIGILDDAPTIKQEEDSTIIGTIPSTTQDEGDLSIGSELLDKEIIITASDNNHIKLQCMINNCGFVINNIPKFDTHLKEIHSNQAWNGYCSVCKEDILPAFAQPTYLDGFSHLKQRHMPNIPSSYINVKPLSALLPVAEDIENITVSDIDSERNESFPQLRIENVVSLVNEECDENIGNSSQNNNDNKVKSSIQYSRNIQQVAMESGNVVICKNKSLSSNCFQDKNSKSRQSNENTIDTENIQQPSTSLKKNIINLPADTEYNISIEDNNESVSLETQTGKIPIVLETMLQLSKMVCIFKCAGRSCSYCVKDSPSFMMHLRQHIKLVLFNDLNDQSFLECLYCKINNIQTGFELKKASPQLLVNHIMQEHGHCMYGCQYCFYIATSARLVELHRLHAHSLMPARILRLLHVNELHNTMGMQGILMRNAAVLPYRCKQGDCIHTSYVLEDFALHLRGHKERRYVCFLCQVEQSQVSLLLHHMAIMHSLALYQCAYCMHGADDELDMLRHCSLHHPMRKPSAYKRQIDDNPQGQNQHDEKNQIKLLPLVSFDQPTSSEILSVMPANDDNSQKHVMSAVKLLLQENENLSDETNTLEVSSIDTNPAKKDDVTLPSPFETSQLEQISTGKVAIVDISHNDSKKVHKGSVEKRKSDETKIESKITKIIDSTAKTAIAEIICLDSDEELDSENISNSSNKPHNRESDLVETKVNLPLSSETQVAPVEDIILLSDEDSSKNSSEIISETVADDKVTSSNLSGTNLYACGKCSTKIKTPTNLNTHFKKCYAQSKKPIHCYHCKKKFDCKDFNGLIIHMIKEHGKGKRFMCDICQYEHWSNIEITRHMSQIHKLIDLKQSIMSEDENVIVIQQKAPTPSMPSKRKLSSSTMESSEPKRFKFGPEETNLLPKTPVLDYLIFCSLCDYSSKVTYNMQRHLQMHIEKASVPSVTPVNPVPNLQNSERHFDKMTNLALSSNIERMVDKGKTRSDAMPTTITSLYPKYVSNRERYACGAIGCDYLSLDEGMLKCHWDTLHTGATDYKCVHCPPSQVLDPNRPLTSARILVHLKMHDSRLFACSVCKYYHYHKQSVERHINEKHKNSLLATVLKLRGPVEQTVAQTEEPTKGTPTMDLKPWHCGVCSYKTMLRAEVIEHCDVIHGLKFQFKCAACSYMNTNAQNVAKHHKLLHSNLEPEVDCIYYQDENSTKDNPESEPIWWKQRKRCHQFINSVLSSKKGQITSLDVDMLRMGPVKQEVLDWAGMEGSELVSKYGALGEPKGDKLVCPLCETYQINNDEDMRSHLYEELDYRKWSCDKCTYKAFNKKRFAEHAGSEHGQLSKEPIEINVDLGKEKWVESVINTQKTIMNEKSVISTESVVDNDSQIDSTNTEDSSLINQYPGMPRISNVQSLQSPEEYILSDTVPENIAPATVKNKSQLDSLIDMFGPLGQSVNDEYSCPRCQYTTKVVSGIVDHLKEEFGINSSTPLWKCGMCGMLHRAYSDARLHAQRAHSVTAPFGSHSAQPHLLQQWTYALIEHQNPCNSSEVLSALKASSALPDDVVMEEENLQGRKCPHCNFRTKYAKTMNNHLWKHFDMKPFKCGYCQYEDTKPGVTKHLKLHHPNVRAIYVKNAIPTNPVAVKDVPIRNFRGPIARSKSAQPAAEVGGCSQTHVCLLCNLTMVEMEIDSHHMEYHRELSRQIVMKGDLVFKCASCKAMRVSIADMRGHHTEQHPLLELNYSRSKVGEMSTRVICLHCQSMFTYMADLKCHHDQTHRSQKMEFRIIRSRNLLEENKGTDVSSPSSSQVDNIQSCDTGTDLPSSYGRIVSSVSLSSTAATGRASLDNLGSDYEFALSIRSSMKRVAKKSTTLLPYADAKRFAKKSTTKLPNEDSTNKSKNLPNPDRPKPFSFYNSRSDEDMPVPVATPQISGQLQSLPRDTNVVLVKEEPST